MIGAGVVLLPLDNHEQLAIRRVHDLGLTSRDVVGTLQRRTNPVAGGSGQASGSGSANSGNNNKKSSGPWSKLKNVVKAIGKKPTQPTPLSGGSHGGSTETVGWNPSSADHKLLDGMIGAAHPKGEITSNDRANGFH
ncbi:hypothetical protein BDQ12DRAFT_726111 [Crucibulum laeve]|uniref:Uncharacterized protein n=1 Tax=Crucibulum laeve TaxID=68775 RepID=A0A5C3LR70_9AGAR|nr:hypothetical protein BDQ12DRAFT_726111 [Crucibulum laeve]